MELSEENLKEEKKILLRTLLKFQEICKKHNLTYYAGFGTCLGAVRHKGFIPWDDDIDVLMPRNDYDKLLSLKKEVLENGYEITDYSNNRLYYSLAKFSDKNTTIVELQQNKVVIGVFIDIFPIDEANNSEETRTLYSESMICQDRLLCVSKEVHLSESIEMIKKRKCLLALRNIYHYVFRVILQKKRYKKFLNNEVKLRKQRGEYYMHYYGTYGFEKDIYPKLWFKDGLETPFENISIVIPCQFDKYLREIYGDYMKLPPLDQRIGHHNVYFFDFEKRWRLDDIKNLKLGKQILKDWYKYE